MTQVCNMKQQQQKVGGGGGGGGPLKTTLGARLEELYEYEFLSKNSKDWVFPLHSAYSVRLSTRVPLEDEGRGFVVRNLCEKTPVLSLLARLAMDGRASDEDTRCWKAGD